MIILEVKDFGSLEVTMEKALNIIGTLLRTGYSSIIQMDNNEICIEYNANMIPRYLTEEELQALVSKEEKTLN